MYLLSFEKQTLKLVLKLCFKVELLTNGLQDIYFLVSKSIQTWNTPFLQFHRAFLNCLDASFPRFQPWKDNFQLYMYSKIISLKYFALTISNYESKVHEWPYTKEENKGNSPLKIKRLITVLLNFLQLTLLQVVPLFTLQIIYHINVVMANISVKRINWNLVLLKLSTRKNQILLWKSITDIRLWILLPLIAIFLTIYLRISLKNKNLFFDLEALMLTSWIRMNIIRPMNF